MTFLQPLVLGALGLVAVPVVIHLLDKFRVTVVPWAATRFLAATLRRQQRRLRFQDLLLLVLRCLYVALLALAFAQPVLNPGDTPAAAGSRHVVLMLDVSASMGQLEGARTRLDLARAEAHAALDTLAPGDQAALILFHERTDPVVPALTADLPALRRALDAARPADRATDLLPALRLATDLLAPVREGTREILLGTDRQALAWSGRETIVALIGTASAPTLRLLGPDLPAVDNLAIASLRPETPFPAPDQAFPCLVEITNHGARPAENIRVTLALDDAPPSDETILPAIAPGATATVRLRARFATSGPHLLRAALPPDRFPADDTRSTALLVGEQQHALLLAEPARATAPGGADASALYLQHGFVPVPPARRPAHSLQLRTLAPLALDTADLARTALIVFPDLPPLPPAIAARLRSFVLGGGALVILPGPSTDPAALAADPALADLLPATLGPAAELPAPGFLAWQSPPYLHPVATRWNDSALPATLAGIRATRRFSLTLASPAPAPTEGAPALGAPAAIVNYADGTPAIAERRAGAGRIVLFSTPADLRWSNLPVHPNFVPFLQRLRAELLPARDPLGLHPAPGAVFQQAVPAELIDRDFLVVRPDGDGSPRPAGKIERHERGGLLRYRDTERAGPYRLLLPGREAPLAAFAVQLPPAESDLRPLPPAELQALLPAAARPASLASAAPPAPGFFNVRRELWPWLAAVALALAVLEMLLAHHLSRHR